MCTVRDIGDIVAPHGIPLYLLDRLLILLTMKYIAEESSPLTSSNCCSAQAAFALMIDEHKPKKPAKINKRKPI
jgi:DNA helicase TIP49 (TBP-interacting protein)